LKIWSKKKRERYREKGSGQHRWGVRAPRPEGLKNDSREKKGTKIAPTTLRRNIDENC